MEIAYSSSVVASDAHLVCRRECRTLVCGGEVEGVGEGTTQVGHSDLSPLARRSLARRGGRSGLFDDEITRDPDHQHYYL